MGEPLIKHYFPVEEASYESRRERAVISPPPFWLHLWWARRPLAASRAIVATLAVDAPSTVDSKFKIEFLDAIKLAGTNGLEKPTYHYQPRVDWLYKRSRIGEAAFVDPFAGGGSVSFEALRLGFKRVVAVEYNPVAYLILKATLEYPLRYGEDLVRDVRQWARFLVERARSEVGEFHARHDKGVPSNYVWVRLYRCPGGKLFPALANPLLSRKTLHALRFDGFRDDGLPIVSVVKVKSPEEAKRYATIKRKTLLCPNATLTSEQLKEQYRREMARWEGEGLYGHHPSMIAAVKLESGDYVEPSDSMVEAYGRAEERLRSEWDRLVLENLVPVEDVREGEVTRTILSRGLDKFYKLFNARQLLLHAAVVKAIREAAERLEASSGSDYAAAVATYLALGLGKLLDYNSAITSWDPYGPGSIRNTFSRHAYTFSEDYGEGNPLSEKSSLSWVFFSATGVIRALERIVEMLEPAKRREAEVEVVLGDAADPAVYASLPDGPVYSVVDPPYYDNVQYAELSDFFYVWFKRGLASFYPEAFSWELTPKEGEIVVNRVRGRGREWFEERLAEAFRALLDAGVERLAVMYAHRTKEGLHAVFKALLDAGWLPVVAWIVWSEQHKSIHIMGKKAARTMIVVGAIPRRGRECLWGPLLEKRLSDAVRSAVAEALRLGLSEVDAMMNSMGAAFAALGCWPVKKPDGNPVKVDYIIDLAWRAAKEALGKTRHG